MKKRIFICDSDLKLTGALLSFLADKYEVASSRPDNDSIGIVEKFEPDVIIANVEHAPQSGLHPFREVTQAGLVFLCNNITPLLEKRIFEMGGDHFLTKPFQLDQLDNRIQSILRLREQASVRNPSLRFTATRTAELEIQTLDRTVKIANRIVALSPLHFELLLAFAKHPERLLSRIWLRQNVWHNSRVSLRTVDAHISKLKREIPELEHLIFNVYGQGYMFSVQRKVA
jgi:DNA-binding response OmpR family regulator